MDTVRNFVQPIKLVQAEAGMGNARVRRFVRPAWSWQELNSKKI
jgi:hypothetical protein